VKHRAASGRLLERLVDGRPELTGVAVRAFPGVGVDRDGEMAGERSGGVVRAVVGEDASEPLGVATLLGGTGRPQGLVAVARPTCAASAMSSTVTSSNPCARKSVIAVAAMCSRREAVGPPVRGCSGPSAPTVDEVLGGVGR
jgi:hypothetical protein